MRHERDRANKRERMRQMRAQEEARLAALPPQQRAAYEEEARRLRVEAALAQKAAAAAALAGGGQRVVVDCSYVTQVEELHAPRHGARAREPAAQGSARSLAKQVEIAMGLNRRSERPLALTLTSFRGALAAFCDHNGAAAWPIARHEGHVADVFASERSNLVMLSPDAPDALDGPLDSAAVYVIGGIVDKSVVKGLSLGWAAAAGVRAARLPVREYADDLGMAFGGANKTPVLSISDVVVALLEAGRTGGDWAAALGAALPERVRRAGVAGAGRRRQPRRRDAAAGRGGGCS
ncbi:MAG: hypothetical protein J3K34DRAFT_517988 [Monoraphidium minutum]|nr:MAG: hypothetical protein J3K34DRAFT_517988 [Monoraphidium minutum]